MFDLIERHAVVFDYMVYVQFDRKTCCGAIDGVWLKIGVAIAEHFAIF